MSAIWSRLRASMSSNEPGWGRSGGPESNDSQSPQDRPLQDRPPQQRPPQHRPQEGPPDLDELWRDLSRRLNGLFGKGGNRGSGGHNGGRGGGGGPGISGRGALAGFGVIGAIALLLWLGSGFFIVPEGQTAAILRFGEFKYMTERAGFQWRLPYPFERHEIVDRSQLRQVEVGYRSNVKNKVPKESLILTGDQSIVDLQFAVQYRIDNPEQFLFENNPSPSTEELIRQATESAMREVVGRRKTDQVLYEEKAQVAEEAQKLTQAILDRYKLGIGVVDLTVQQAQPPEQVQAAFEDANKADQDRQRLINEGQAYANDVIPRARGTADRLLLEAQGYRDRITAQAEGDALRFTQIYEEFSRAPQVTRERMYLETMQQIFSNTSKVYLDSKANNSLLYLPLDRLMQDTRARAGTDPSRPGGPETSPAAQPPSVSTIESARGNLRSRDRDSGR
ncbi:MAG: FtsH protease activity modulator HflK [Lautropia sp.]